MKNPNKVLDAFVWMDFTETWKNPSDLGVDPRISISGTVGFEMGERGKIVGAPWKATITIYWSQHLILSLIFKMLKSLDVEMRVRIVREHHPIGGWIFVQIFHECVDSVRLIRPPPSEEPNQPTRASGAKASSHLENRCWNPVSIQRNIIRWSLLMWSHFLLTWTKRHYFHLITHDANRQRRKNKVGTDPLIKMFPFHLHHFHDAFLSLLH